MAEEATIGLTAHSDKYDPDDDRWREQIGDLRHELNAETEALRVVHTSVPGTKGAIDELILSLGSAGAFTAAVEVLRAWLARDKTR